MLYSSLQIPVATVISRCLPSRQLYSRARPLCKCALHLLREPQALITVSDTCRQQPTELMCAMLTNAAS